MSSRAVAAKHGMSKTAALYYRKGLTHVHSKRASTKKGRRMPGQ
jgi:hypothetical protein